MELRRAADVLVRCSNPPLTTLFAPSSMNRWQAGRTLSHKTSSNHCIRRTFTSTCPRKLDLPPRETTAKPTKTATPQEPVTSLPQTAQKLGWLNPAREGVRRTGPALTATEQKERVQSIMDGGSSSDNLLSQFNDARLKPVDRSTPMDVSRMQPLYGLDTSMSKAAEEVRRVNHKPKLQMTMKPSLGRTVNLNEYVDISRGISMLEMSCGRNKVRSDSARQRFHERGGLKRKRLARDRWRRKFLAGFKHTITRVRDLARQGW